MKASLAASSPIFVALDVDDANRAMDLAKQLAPVVGGFKLGPRLLMRSGGTLIQQLAKLKPVFVDCKFFDIPNTMASAVKAVFDQGASFVTVHAQAGEEALQRVIEVENEFSDVRVLAVTILTSFDQSGLPEVSQSMPIQKQVLSLAQMASRSGVSGLVCSGAEVAHLRQSGVASYLVVPGIRLASQGDDQKRTSHPGQALSAGASALVVGRPIVESSEPLVAAQKFVAALAK